MDETELRERYLRWCMETGSLMSENGYEAFTNWGHLQAQFDNDELD